MTGHLSWQAAFSMQKTQPSAFWRADFRERKIISMENVAIYKFSSLLAMLSIESIVESWHYQNYKWMKFNLIYSSYMYFSKIKQICQIY